MVMSTAMMRFFVMFMVLARQCSARLPPVAHRGVPEARLIPSERRGKGSRSFWRSALLLALRAPAKAGHYVRDHTLALLQGVRSPAACGASASPRSAPHSH